MELRVGGCFRLGRKIGGGSFGDIYLGAFARRFIDRLFANFCRRKYCDTRRSCYKARMYENKASAAAHRGKTLQIHAWRHRYVQFSRRNMHNAALKKYYLITSFTWQLIIVLRHSHC